MRDRILSAHRQLVLVPRAIAIVWSAAKTWTLAWLFLLIVQGLLPVATLLIGRRLVDTLVASSNQAGSVLRVESALPLALGLGLLFLVAEVARGLSEWVRTGQAERVQDSVSARIHAQAVRVDYAFYESSDYLDKLYRARYEAPQKPIQVLEGLGALLQHGLTAVALVLALAPFGWWIPLVLGLSGLPLLAVVLIYSLRMHEWKAQHTVEERRAWYQEWVLTTRECAAEVRLFDLGDHFRGAYQTSRGKLREGKLRLTRNQGLAQAAATCVTLAVAAWPASQMLTGALAGRITLGDLALFFGAYSQAQRVMHGAFEGIKGIYASTLTLGHLFDFLALQPEMRDPESPLPAPARLNDGIRFRGVTFSYPESGRDALHDFNLHLPAGKVTAIVGANGAGKSTLIKLLCRLYDPDCGAVELDGADLRSLSLEQLRRKITVMFQDPVELSATVRENIALSDLVRRDPAAIEAAAARAGADVPVSRMKDGYDTLLGKWMPGGTDLSGGEWQRIALARAFYRDAEIIILDEPTSAMDAWAEADWLNRFLEFARGRTALLITHRFTTAMRADVIHVLERGEILETGTHKELLARGGAYATGWLGQVQNRG